MSEESRIKEEIDWRSYKMGEYILISAIIVFIGGLITIAFQMLNHKFPKHHKTAI